MLNNASHASRLFDKVEMVDNELFGKVLQLVGLVQVGSNEAIGSIVDCQGFDELDLTPEVDFTNILHMYSFFAKCQKPTNTNFR